jgi:hypothetical protein
MKIPFLNNLNFVKNGVRADQLGRESTINTGEDAAPQILSSISTFSTRSFSKGATILTLLLFIIISSILTYLVTRRSLIQTSAVQASDPRTNLSMPLAQETLNKKYVFPLTDGNGNTVTNFDYSIIDAQLRNEIVVNGKPATAIKGKSFLILNINLKNDYKQPINVNAKDYIRLAINGDMNTLYAADIHNDPVNVQAISTKPTRIGFVIDDTTKKLSLSIGQIKDEHKQVVSLNIK